ncbi:T9SS type A sorting domain-containing protein [Flavobacterium sp.]|uniref:T9SS type A sorting domain-containing protein n=1 Tax=Flavobacterium sp. TaxID=239 RepID=UPI002623974E|nr:T9SS type A sorting domain-containing protein [Flavobacterium sp.]
MERKTKKYTQVKLLYAFTSFFYLGLYLALAQSQNVTRVWGTYFGDERFYLQDSRVDNSGNLYIVGVFIGNKNSAPTFNTNAYQANFGGGESDGFIAKFSAEGSLITCSYFGGEGIDGLSAIDVDPNNNVYISGFTTSETQIATQGSYQQVKSLGTDLFVAKFNESGSLVWSTYFGGEGDDGEGLNTILSTGVSTKRTHISHDKESHCYLLLQTNSQDLGTDDTFQPNKENSNYLIAKFSETGFLVWSTYYGINLQNQANSLKSGNDAVYVSGVINECTPGQIPNNYFGTANAFQEVKGSCRDTFLSKFDTTGQRLWSTYYGGTSSELTSDNALSIVDGHVYFSGIGSSSMLATAGTFQSQSGQVSSPFLAKFTSEGERVWASFNGLSQNQAETYLSNNTAVEADLNGNILLSGTIGLNANISSAQAWQEDLYGINDAYMAKFTSTGQKLWGTYYGGSNFELRAIAHSYGENVFLVGSSLSTDGLSTSGALQENLILFDESTTLKKNIFIAYFIPIPLSVADNHELTFEIFPNPSTGAFTLASVSSEQLPFEISIFDLTGKQIFNQHATEQNTVINLQGIARGIYMVVVKSKNTSQVSKLVVQ